MVRKRFIDQLVDYWFFEDFEIVEIELVAAKGSAMASSVSNSVNRIHQGPRKCPRMCVVLLSHIGSSKRDFNQADQIVYGWGSLAMPRRCGTRVLRPPVLLHDG